MKIARIMKKKNRLVSLPCLPTFFTLCMTVLAVASPHSAQSQEWRFEPIFRVGVEYDDNARLSIRTDEEVTLEGFLVDLRADIKYSSAGTSFSLQPRFVSRNYTDDANTDADEPDFDSDDFFLRSTFRHQGQSSTFGFRVNFDEQTVRTGERANSDLEIEDPDEITDDDTGRILLIGNRSKWRIAPYWDYQLSNISSIGADLDYFDVQYEDIFAGLLRDYTDTRLNLNYRRAFSDINTGLLTVTARRYDTFDTVDDITGYGLMAGFEHALSQKMRVKAMIGLEDTQRSNLDADPEITGYVTLTRNLETIRMFAQYRRSVNAGGAGITIRDSLNLNFRRRLSEKISAGLGIRAYQSKGVRGSIAIEDRAYVKLQSSFLWYLAASMVIEVDYRYTVTDRSVALGELEVRSNSNQINLWFTYQPRTVPKL